MRCAGKRCTYLDKVTFYLDKAKVLVNSRVICGALQRSINEKEQVYMYSYFLRSALVFHIT